jgi:hypothetical protein
MSQQSLEERVALLEQAVSALQHVQNPKGHTRPRMTAELEEAHHEMEAYGRYYRVTGKDPPADWKPGDPIPEPDVDWCPR